MSKQRPWHTALSSLVVTLADDVTLAASTITEIAAHEAITAEKAIGAYLPVAIEAADARAIHQWLESLAGVRYVDVVFCSTELPEEETQTTCAS
ncbi:MAG: hypothetical protein ACSHYA_08755 [Opitutaceae bacterium]